MVVGSGCRDMPKYAGEGAASRRTPGTLGVPYHINYVNYGHFWGIFKDTRFGHTASEACHLVCRCNVIQQCCDVICDVTVPHMHWSHDHLL